VQLTQKTNQFNLTTQRYAIGDIRNFYDSPNYGVISLEAEDKFGSSGVTGLCIVKYDGNIAEIDSFLMSCRILGRNIELIFLEEIIHMLLQNKITLVKSSFIKTVKNSQVESFFDAAGFTVVAQTNTKKQYELNINNFKKTNINYIQRVWKKR
jgi:FkbH-like protein